MSDWILLRGLTRETRHWGGFEAALLAHGLAGRGERVVFIDLPGNGAEHEREAPRSVIAMMDFVRERKPEGVREELARAAVRLADAIEAPAIVVITRRGLLGQTVSSFRPKRAIIYAFTNMSTTRRKLWMSRSVVPFKMDFSSDPEKTVAGAFERLRQRNRLLPGDAIVVISDVPAGDQNVTAVQVRLFN